MDLYQSLFRPLAFKLDPERVHELAMKHIVQTGRMGTCTHPLQCDPVELFGVKFPNRLGLAAGFDKNGIAVDQWHKYGFGFAEIGTVTWHAQPGNSKPRLFRLQEDKGLINRMGFNNLGAEAMARTLEESNPQIPIGINLGKSKITELPDAHIDYSQSYRLLRNLGQYFVVNVSSPNTPGLRSLQDREPLLRIFGDIQDIDSSKPLFLKIAPDLSNEALDEILQVASDCKLTGLIATNTTTGRDGLTSNQKSESGGLSGKPVQAKSNEVLQYLNANKPEKLLLMGVGGVFNHADFQEKKALGAELVQLYTGWVYGGPSCVPAILSET